MNPKKFPKTRYRKTPFPPANAAPKVHQPEPGLPSTQLNAATHRQTTSKSNQARIIKSFTTGYSDVEDRLWARLVLGPETEVRLWFTRRFTQRVCEHMLELLYKSFGKGQSTQDPEILKMLIKAQLAAELETQKANIGKTPAPPAPAAQVIVTHAGLCTGVEITPADEGKNWAIVWRAEGDQYALLIDRSSVAKLTIGLIQQARAREWNFPPHIGEGLV